jgi:hypothetical protein
VVSVENQKKSEAPHCPFDTRKTIVLCMNCAGIYSAITRNQTSTGTSRYLSSRQRVQGPWATDNWQSQGKEIFQQQF